jgi:hypothetical protein
VIDKIKGIIKWVKSTDCLAGLTFFFASLLFFVDLFGGRYLLTERDLVYFIYFLVESIRQFFGIPTPAIFALPKMDLIPNSSTSV